MKSLAAALLLSALAARAAAAPLTPKLKSGLKAAPAALPAKVVKGEVALTDAIKGILSVRVGKGALREFSVGDATKILACAEGKPETEAAFETVSVGDAVEVRSADGRLADEIRVRPGAR